MSDLPPVSPVASESNIGSLEHSSTVMAMIVVIITQPDEQLGRENWPICDVREADRVALSLISDLPNKGQPPRHRGTKNMLIE